MNTILYLIFIVSAVAITDVWGSHRHRPATGTRRYLSSNAWKIPSSRQHSKHHRHKTTHHSQQHHNQQHHHQEHHKQQHQQHFRQRARSFKRHARQDSLFSDVIHNRGSFRAPFPNMFLHHPSSPHYWHLKQLQERHKNIMGQLHAQIDHHLTSMREHIAPTYHKHHSRPHIQSLQPQSRLQYPHERLSHSQHYLNPRHHPQPQRHHYHYPLHTSTRQRKPPHREDREQELASKQVVGRKQYRIFRGPTKSIPEDVEVFNDPQRSEPHRNTTITDDPSHEGTNPKKDSREKCVTAGSEDNGILQRPPHHKIFKSTTPSHGTSNLKPVFSRPAYSHRFTPVFPEALPTSLLPFYNKISSSWDPQQYLLPVNKFPHNSKHQNHLFTLSDIRASSQSFSERSRTTPTPAGNKDYVKINVEDHLDPMSSADQGRVGQAEGTIPCIKCPPDAHVEAPRGKDCVYAHVPNPFSCTPRGWPRLETVVTEGPRPGTRLQEGSYAMVIAVVAVGDLSTPITSCNINYNVEVRKCPELVGGPGLEVRCTAGRAWGSHCIWRCSANLILQGASSTTCIAHHRPHWSHPPPTCTEPPSAPPSGRKRGCSSLPEVHGGRYVCEAPGGFPRLPPVLKDGPGSKTIRRDVASSGHHPPGTVCKVECGPGWVIGASQRDRNHLTCTSGSLWNHRPPTCLRQVAPALGPGECENTSLSLPNSPLSLMPLPRFTTGSGHLAHVTCLLEGRSQTHYSRTCTATDPELETSTVCQYTITLTGGTVVSADVSPSTPDDPNRYELSEAANGSAEGGDTTANTTSTTSTTSIHHTHNKLPVEGTFPGKSHTTSLESGGKDDRDDFYDVRETDDNGNGELYYYYDASERDLEDDFELDDDDNNEDDHDAALPETRTGDKSAEAGRRKTLADTVDGNRLDAAEGTGNTHRVNDLETSEGVTTLSTPGSHDHLPRARRIESGSHYDHFNNVISMSKNMEDTSGSPKKVQGKIRDEIRVRSQDYSGDRPEERRGNEKTQHQTSTQTRLSRVQQVPLDSDAVAAKVPGTQMRPGKYNESNYGFKTSHEGSFSKSGTEGAEVQKQAKKTLESGPRRPDMTDDRTKRKEMKEDRKLRGYVARQDINRGTEELEERNGETRIADEGSSTRDTEEVAGSQPATMEAVVTMKMMVQECSVVEEVSQVLQNALLLQNTCKELTCHHPHTTCTHTSRGSGTVDVVWAVGGVYETLNTEDGDYHVPEVETGIASVLESTQQVLRSSHLRRTLEALGATLDPSSFNLTQLDLVCRQPGHGLDSHTSRCVVCTPGTYSRDGSCAPCRPGTYMDQAGRSTCVPCKVGTQAPHPGMVHCLTSNSEDAVNQSRNVNPTNKTES